MHSRRPHDALAELLVLDAQAGEEQAFARLYRLWAPRLARHIARLTADHDGAKDVSQNTWLAIARGLRRLDDPASFSTWAYRIATHKAADWTRERQRQRRVDAISRDATRDNGAAPPDLDPVREAIRSLSPDQRAMLSMHYADGLRITHIAEVLQIPTGTVKSRLHAARAELKQILERQEGPS